MSTFMGNFCGPVAVAEYERQCGNDFIFSQHTASTGDLHTPKDGDPRADQDGVDLAPSSPDPSCAAERTAGALSAPAAIFAPPARCPGTPGTTTAGEPSPRAHGEPSGPASPGRPGESSGPPAPLDTTADPRAPFTAGVRGGRRADVCDALAAIAEDRAL